MFSKVQIMENRVLNAHFLWFKNIVPQLNLVQYSTNDMEVSRGHG